ncbi:hypothetical protein CO652_22535 [Rhizobium sp. H4]|nr:hypothetical protein CO652_22535 [Rhizobium sp. H4]
MPEMVQGSTASKQVRFAKVCRVRPQRWSIGPQMFSKLGSKGHQRKGGAFGPKLPLYRNASKVRTYFSPIRTRRWCQQWTFLHIDRPHGGNDVSRVASL